MSAIDDLPPLREVIRRHDLVAKKSLGQNFLLDLNLTSRIARSAGPFDDVVAVEIGAGPGGLTRALLACGVKRVIAIEKDERCLAALAEIAKRYENRLEIWPQDALEIDFQSRFANGSGDRFRIVSNLPYNVGTALLTRWVENETWPPWYDRLTLMFQREVAERIVASPRERKAYGRLAVLCGWRMQARILFDVPPAAFTPAPKVVSSVVELAPRAYPLPCDRRALSRVVAAAFGQRRKMLRQSLKPLCAASGLTVSALLESAAIEPTRRAEEIDVAGFVRLANALSVHQPA